MTIASGVAKQVRYKKETSYGTLAGATGGQILRRVTSSIDLTKDTYQSQEIRTDYQIADFRHGVRRVTGTINGELSADTYADFFAAALRRDFTSGAAVALTTNAVSITATGSLYNLTRAAGSWESSAIKIGDVVRLTGAGLTAGNTAKNLLVTARTSGTIKVKVLNATALTSDAAVTGVTVTVTGKKTYVPTTSHTDDSFTVEHWFSDVAQSERFTGCKVTTVGVNLPPTGMATVDIGVNGKDMSTATAAYFTSPTAANTQGIMAAVNGVLVVNGTPVAVCTGLQISIDGGFTGEPVVGANTIPNQFPGRVNVTGQFTAYFEDATYRDAFLNETEFSLIGVFTENNEANADFVSFVLPRVKIGGSSKSDGEVGIQQTVPFQALLASDSDYDATTIVIQDSAA